MVYRGNATWQGGNRMMEFYAALHESLFWPKADIEIAASGVRFRG
jgi:hypothetical protein